MDDSVGLNPLPAVRLTGQESFTGTDASVTDFWRWAFNDLRTNALRGVLAEYLVALALGVADGTRIEWDGYDVTTADGVRVEVKSSAYLQSWPQSAHSAITFSGLRSRHGPPIRASPGSAPSTPTSTSSPCTPAVNTPPTTC